MDKTLTLPIQVRRSSSLLVETGNAAVVEAATSEATQPPAHGEAEGGEVPLPSGEGDHLDWLTAKISTEPPPTGAAAAPGEVWCEQNRRTLYAILAMLGTTDKCKDVLETTGLGGQLRPGDQVFFRGHTGRWFGVKGKDIVCNKPDRDSATLFTIDSKTSPLRHGSKAAFRVDPEAAGGETSSSAKRMAVVPATFDVKLMPPVMGVNESDAQFTMQLDHGSVVMSGMLVYLKAAGTGNMVDVQGDTVRARTQDKGTLQRIAIEKLPAESEIPQPCPPMELTLEQKVWCFRRGAQHALVDRQELARFLAGHKPGCKEMLQCYTRLWEKEWRVEWSQLLRGSGLPQSPESPQSQCSPTSGDRSARRPQTRPRAKTKDWLFDMFSAISGDDRDNGDLFVGALRSFFATALRMSQLEADPVMRVIEAFADCLVSDTAFLEGFTPSMLPEKERKCYKTPDEVIFGLTYTTLMLNTDFHNKQVNEKTWTAKKFAGAGKDCGVTAGLMMQVYKNVQKEEL